MRIAIAVGVGVACGCGDNAPLCGRVQVLDANRNIWAGQIAVDSERVYYSDYDNGAGTRLVLRQPRDGGQPLVIAARPETSRLGYGMAVYEGRLYWAAEAEPAGYALFSTPVLGGRTRHVGLISTCTASGVAVDEVAAYAGAIRCGDQPARVVAIPHDGSGAYEVWSSDRADVTSLVSLGGDLVLATTAGLVRVTQQGSELLDGRPAYHVVLAGDELVYSTEEEVLARPATGGATRTLYTFRTPVTEIRAFAVDGGDLYIAEPPELVFVPAGGEPTRLVRDIGTGVTHVVARDGAAYWSTLALRGTIGLVGTYAGGVLRVDRPCD